ncbi:MAG: hypothetical protein C7B46_17295 [Sulfobacillus benefaciens]|uniref:Uncharacterized protein n=1 Tax=Sulfobacillus benefaciens TaxID=453960 RepID=A0A2T2X9C0_9FIRM|nr:MAG: hypothetical protein C7B46_17295 [Sulfobacillus benefaciens]
MIRIRKSLKVILVFGIVAFLLSGCSPQSTSVSNSVSHTPVPSTSSPNVTVVASMNSKISTDQAKNPVSAAEATMSWKLSNDKTVHVSSNSDVVASPVLGDIAVVTLKVPDVRPIPMYYFLYMMKKNNVWSLKGIMASPLDNSLQKVHLPPYSNLIDATIQIKGMGRFEEFYSPGTAITLANISENNSNLPSGETMEVNARALPTAHVYAANSNPPIIQHSGAQSTQRVTVFSQGAEHGLYYRFGSGWIWVAGTVSQFNLTRLSKGLQSHVYNVLKTGYASGYSTNS